MQKKSLLFEFPSLLLPTKLGQPMHCQSAQAELPSPNLALLLDPVHRAIREVARRRDVQFLTLNHELPLSGHPYLVDMVDITNASFALTTIRRNTFLALHQ